LLLASRDIVGQNTNTMSAHDSPTTHRSDRREDLTFPAGELLDQASSLLHAGPICNDCLGRAFGMKGHGLTNEQRGRSLRTVLAMFGDDRLDKKRPPSAASQPDDAETPCWICGGLFAHVTEWARQAADAVAGVEFSTYLVGAKISVRIETADRLAVDRYALAHAESLKHAFNREVGKAFEAVAGGTVSFGHPDVTFLVDLETGRLESRLASLYVYGRYRKLTRGIPQTHWPCRACRGRGCAACQGTGRQYPESVEEWIGAPLIRAANAEAACLHGAGREDIDARMLGSGRPFVLEIRSPRVRSLKLAPLRDEINRNAANRVEVGDLRFVPASAVAVVKETRNLKRYLARIVIDRGVEKAELESALGGLIGEIHQQTPERVAHRRADRTRIRHLIETQLVALEDNGSNAEIELLTDAGLYVKELVSGDEGRTRPSLAALLDSATRVAELDVVDVRFDERLLPKR